MLWLLCLWLISYWDLWVLKILFPRCEPFDTYPRTYDLLHAAGLFSVEQKRYEATFVSLVESKYKCENFILFCGRHKCNISSIMLEMDRILRHGGIVYIRDTVSVMDELQEIAKAMGWEPALRDTGEGQHSIWKILICEKRIPWACPFDLISILTLFFYFFLSKRRCIFFIP